MPSPLLGSHRRDSPAARQVQRSRGGGYRRARRSRRRSGGAPAGAGPQAGPDGAARPARLKGKSCSRAPSSGSPRSSAYYQRQQRGETAPEERAVRGARELPAGSGRDPAPAALRRRARRLGGREALVSPCRSLGSPISPFSPRTTALRRGLKEGGRRGEPRAGERSRRGRGRGTRRPAVAGAVRKGRRALAGYREGLRAKRNFSFPPPVGAALSGARREEI